MFFWKKGRSSLWDGVSSAKEGVFTGASVVESEVSAVKSEASVVTSVGDAGMLWKPERATIEVAIKQRETIRICGYFAPACRIRLPASIGGARRRGGGVAASGAEIYHSAAAKLEFAGGEARLSQILAYGSVYIEGAARRGRFGVAGTKARPMVTGPTWPR